MSRRNPVTSYSPTEAAAIAPESLELIVAAIETLSERRAAVLRMRFGLNGPVKSHAEIAEFYNTTASKSVASRWQRSLRCAILLGPAT